MIQFKHVSKRYGRQKALDDVSFTLPSGKIIGLIGENGSGKSTTLKLIAGLIRPTQGNVYVDQQPVSRQISRIVSYLTELDEFYRFFRVGEMVDFYASQFADFNIAKAAEILSFMQLDRDKKIQNLSKGNRGRLKIVLSLAREVPVILMDEPFSGLDPMVRESIVKGLISFVEPTKQTVIITTHEIKEVEPILEMAVVMKQGRMIGMRDVEELRFQEHISIVEWMKQLYA